MFRFKKLMKKQASQTRRPSRSNIWIINHFLNDKVKFMKYNFILILMLCFSIGFAQNEIEYNIDETIGNSVSRYSYRVDGSWNGCIGESPDCSEIPSDLDLIKSILSLRKDYNKDNKISGHDLEDAVMESEDLNKDGKKDIYDLTYSFNKVIYAEDFEYFIIAKIIQHKKYNELAIELTEAHDIFIWDPSSSSEKPDLKDSRSVVLLAGNVIDKTKYINKTVVLKGKFNSGNTQAFIDGLLFSVIGIIGIVN
jgi:hypothetical protein